MVFLSKYCKKAVLWFFKKVIYYCVGAHLYQKAFLAKIWDIVGKKSRRVI